VSHKNTLPGGFTESQKTYRHSRESGNLKEKIIISGDSGLLFVPHKNRNDASLLAEGRVEPGFYH